MNHVAGYFVDNILSWDACFDTIGVYMEQEGQQMNIWLIIGAFAVLVVAIGAYFWAAGGGQDGDADEQATTTEEVLTTEVDVRDEVSRATNNPTEDLPNTNPFETETNPFKGYRNPFGNE